MFPSSLDHSDSEAPAPSDSPADVTPLVDVVACDGVDTSPVVVAAHGLHAEVRISTSPEGWFEHLDRIGQEDGLEPADLAVVVGSAERMVTQRLVARGVTAAPDSCLVAAVVDASLDHVMAVVNQGAQGLLVLPSPGERVVYHLRGLLDPAVERQAQRRAAIRHRRALAILTEAERSVLDCMLVGMANKQIAQKLAIGLRTVELRRSKIMRKMRATNLSQLICFVCSARKAYR